MTGTRKYHKNWHLDVEQIQRHFVREQQVVDLGVPRTEKRQYVDFHDYAWALTASNRFKPYGGFILTIGQL
jgi:hypothetical protein